VAVEPIEAVPDPLRDPDAWFDVIRGVDPGPGPVVGSVERHVIAFKTWCHLVTEFGARDRR
jgi:hypothetical protein